jgi:pimeloyl-ACP methyl ester carboxylesterase
MVEIRQGSCRLPGVDIRYEEAGDGPAVLLMHAGVADRRMWRSQLKALAPVCRVIAWDARGFGQSADGPGSFSYAEDIRAFLDGLGIERVVLVGCSMFGTPAVRFALDAPDRVRGLALVGAWVHGFEPQGPEDELDRQAMEAEASGDWERQIALEARLWLAGPRRPLGAVAQDLQDLFRAMGEDHRKAHDPGAEDVDGARSDIGRLGEIGCPTLVVVGDEEVAGVVELAEHLTRTIPRAELHTLRGTAHLPPLEIPDAFNRLLADWLARIPA